MNQNSSRYADMDKENEIALKSKEPTVRITRARAKALSSSSSLPDEKKTLNNSKRAVSDVNQSALNLLHNKKRAVLQDVTNVLCENAYLKSQANKQTKRIPGKKTRVAPGVLVDLKVQDVKENITENAVKDRTEESQENKLVAEIKKNLTIQPNLFTRIQEKRDSFPHKPSIRDKGKLLEKSNVSDDPKVVDIDSNHDDPLMCSLYAADIYKVMSVTELDRRPLVDYISKLQRDITKNMRGILVDWLVEVSEEYRLVPDTLYLTVNLIDRFLSENLIEKQKLQLVGITCMLIASKYEEICAPRIEEFCLITDNTYSKEEVVNMESQVLNFLRFHLSVPTTKKFLRRFIQAAQISYEIPRVELEFLANYLAELTLTEYSFLKFLPSLIAASAVFLARWTLDQSDHPWNHTLEHYTNYKASELKPTVLELLELQINSKESSLNAIREKYRLDKFKSVANLSSPKLVESLFETLTTAGPSDTIIR